MRTAIPGIVRNEQNQLNSVRRFETKSNATKGGAVERAVGTAGGSVKIQKENGRFQERADPIPEAQIPKRLEGLDLQFS